MLYDDLILEAERHGVDVYEKPLKKRIKGLYADGIVWINSRIPTKERACILAEELGHYHNSAGDILDQSDIVSRKQEKAAREWAYERLVPLDKIIEAHHARVGSRHDFAEFLGVTEPFLQAAIERYREKYGLYVTRGHYTIYFDPLGVIEEFN
jgi:Zn-dependent peptidase ImmA (M78 family)